jgi:D-serine/D-alanine/glycine transporter
MVFGLANDGDAPKLFGRLSSRKVPENALFLTCVLLLASVALLYAGKDIGAAFDMVSTVAAVCYTFVWSIILASYLVFRKRRPGLHKASPFKMPGGIPMIWVVFAFFAFIVWALTTQADTLTALLATPIWFVILGVAYAIVRRSPFHQARVSEWKANATAENASRVPTWDIHPFA